MLSRKDISQNQINHLLVLQAVNRAEMDIAEVTNESRRKRHSVFACSAI